MDIFDERSAKPMLIATECPAFDSDEYSYELKMDGERCLAYLDSNETELINRRDRRLLAQFPELANVHRQARLRCILDGELIVGIGGKADFEHVKRRGAQKNAYVIRRLSVEFPCTFVAVDVLYYGKKLITDLPLAERQGILHSLVDEDDHIAIVRSVDGRGREFFRKVAEQGLEGVIAKRKASLYQMGKRTRDWAKFKNWLHDDFVVCGYIMNERAATASLVLGQYGRDGVMDYNGRVTLGTRREEFRRIRKLPRIDSPPFAKATPEGKGGAVWVAPQLVCSVSFMCWTDNRRLRQPFFNRLVRDKPPRSVVGSSG